MRRKGQRTSGGGRQRSDSWQVIYMDLMTIIMVFFVILWSINQREDIGLSDTLGEETVILTAGLICFLLLRKRQKDNEAQ